MASTSTDHRTLGGSRRGGVVGMIFVALFGLIATACSIPPTGSAHSGVSTNTKVSHSGSGSGETVPLAAQMNTIGVETVQGVQLRVKIVCGPWVVLATHGSIYSQSELSAIRLFVAQNAGSMVGGTDILNGFVAGEPSTLPPTLSYAAGYLQCTAEYDVTNTGQSLAQLNGVGFQPTQDPALFSYRYDLLDGCPYMQVCHCEGCGAAFGCGYAGVIQMTMDSSAVMKMFPPSSDPSCPTPINLDPGATVPIDLTFDKPVGDEAVWFRGIPTLNVTTPTGTTTLAYPSLPNNLVFVNFGDHSTGTATGVAVPPSAYQLGLAQQDANVQVVCYTQSGDTFDKTVAAYQTVLTLNITTGGNSSLCF